MDQAEVAALEVYLSKNPTAGDEMAGTGGCRKIRWAGKGHGKSGGFRIITFFTGIEFPVFLVTVFAKGERANLSKTERNQLAVITKAIVVAYRKRVVKVSGQR